MDREQAPLRIIITGGTFDKHYDAIAGQLTFSNTHLPEILAMVNCRIPFELEIAGLIDSLDMQEQQRQHIADICASCPESRIVITHGTDTMKETALLLGNRRIAKTIVLTGAMVPYSVSHSDALFNLGSAITASGLLEKGVYVCMNGRVFRGDNFRKNRKAGFFEPEF